MSWTGRGSIAFWASLRNEATAALKEAGCTEDTVTLIFAADLRYLGQQSELTVALDVDPRTHHDASRIVDVFVPAYKQALRRQSVPCPHRTGHLAGDRARAHHSVQPGDDLARDSRPAERHAGGACLERRASRAGLRSKYARRGPEHQRVRRLSRSARPRR